MLYMLLNYLITLRMWAQSENLQMKEEMFCLLSFCGQGRHNEQSWKCSVINYAAY